MRWIKSLQSGVAKYKGAPVVIGATAGVRHKMEQGHVTLEDAEKFFELVRSHLKGREVVCTVLTGEEESKYEFLAVKYCVSLKMPEHLQSDLGMISCGGMSSQVYFRGKALSLPTTLSHAHTWVLNDGVEKGLKRFKQHLTEKCRLDQYGGQSGLFIGIELFAESARRAGFEGKVVTLAEAAKALKASLRAAKEALSKRDLAEFEGWDISVITGPVLLLHFVKSLHPDSTVLVTHKFEFSESHRLQPNWILGMCASNLGLVEHE